jgi:uncharacterized protein YggE
VRVPRPAPLAAALALWTLQPAAAQPAGPAPSGTPRLTVVGRAAIDLPPDFATVQIGVAARGATASVALSDNSNAVARTIAIAKAMGVEPPDVATSAVSLSPAVKTVRGPGGGLDQQPDGYQASNVVTVRLADMARLGEFLRQAVESGANRIDGVSFGLRAPDVAERQAGAAATRDAMARAAAVAGAAGVVLGPLESIAIPPRGDGPSAPMATMRLSASAPARAVPIEAGTITVSSEVEIVWALRQP